MNKRNLLRVFLCTLLSCFCVSAWGETEMIDLSSGVYDATAQTITWTGTSCTITQEKNTSPNVPVSSYISAPRWYPKNKISFAASNMYTTITSVEIVCQTSNYASVLQSSTFSDGASATLNTKTVTITTTGDFSIVMSAQSRISSIKVMYEITGSIGKANEPILPSSCKFVSSYNATITNNEPNATVYYTMDGTNPTTSSSSFTGGSKMLTITATTTIKAMAVVAGKGHSSVVSATYTCQATAPTIPSSQIFTDTLHVVIANNEPNSTIYYTTDGSDPTLNSNSITGDTIGFTITESTTLKAMAVIDGKANSQIASAKYIFSFIPSANVFQDCSLNGDTLYLTGRGWVDMGLSVKWANMNVGATTAEGYGDYFAWGETSTKTTYSWSTYKWCSGSNTTLTKYNTNSSYGTVDNKTQLELADDAARVNWGGSWRMPTDAEWTELRDSCTWTWTTQNGVNGYKVTATNGNSLFLPATGFRCDASLYSAGAWVRYWSSSLYSGNPYCVWYASGVDRNYVFRYYGHSVRPVCP